MSVCHINRKLNKGIMKYIHHCTNCGVEKPYKTFASWNGTRYKLLRTGELYCSPCAGKIGRARSSKKPTGRPKGVKTDPEKMKYYSRPGAGKRLNSILTFEQRMLGIAKRNGYNTYEEYKETLTPLRAYRIDVWRVTNRQPLHELANFNKRGVNGQEGAYTLDHIYSIKKGFMEGISPEVIGHIDNL